VRVQVVLRVVVVVVVMMVRRTGPRGYWTVRHRLTAKQTHVPQGPEDGTARWRPLWLRLAETMARWAARDGAVARGRMRLDMRERWSLSVRVRMRLGVGVLRRWWWVGGVVV